MGLRIVLRISTAPIRTFGQFVSAGNNNNLPPFGSFSRSDFDVVGLQSGKLHIHIPILEVPQRGGKWIKENPKYNEHVPQGRDSCVA